MKWTVATLIEEGRAWQSASVSHCGVILDSQGRTLLLRLPAKAKDQLVLGMLLARAIGKALSKAVKKHEFPDQLLQDFYSGSSHLNAVAGGC